MYWLLGRSQDYCFPRRQLFPKAMLSKSFSETGSPTPKYKDYVGLILEKLLFVLVNKPPFWFHEAFRSAQDFSPFPRQVNWQPPSKMPQHLLVSNLFTVFIGKIGQYFRNGQCVFYCFFCCSFFILNIFFFLLCFLINWLFFFFWFFVYFAFLFFIFFY